MFDSGIIFILSKKSVWFSIVQKWTMMKKNVTCLQFYRGRRQVRTTRQSTLISYLTIRFWTIKVTCKKELLWFYNQYLHITQVLHMIILSDCRIWSANTKSSQRVTSRFSVEKLLLAGSSLLSPRYYGLCRQCTKFGSH